MNEEERFKEKIANKEKFSLEELEVYAKYLQQQQPEHEMVNPSTEPLK